MDKAKLVLLDIDKTLFDRIRYSEFKTKKVLELTGIDSSTEEKVYKQTLSEIDVFNKEHYLSLLSKEVDLSNIRDALSSALFDSSILMEFLFPDVSHFLEQISIDAKIGILSKGDYDFQKSKITTFEELLEKDKIYIFEDKIAQANKVVSENHDFKVYFIDNDMETLAAYKKTDPSWTTILIERYGSNDYNYVSDFKINSLLEVLEIVNK